MKIECTEWLNLQERSEPEAIFLFLSNTYEWGEGHIFIADVKGKERTHAKERDMYRCIDLQNKANREKHVSTRASLRNSFRKERRKKKRRREKNIYMVSSAFESLINDESNSTSVCACK